MDVSCAVWPLGYLFSTFLHFPSCIMLIYCISVGLGGRNPPEERNDPMTYDEAMESRVTLRQALRELQGHGFTARQDGNRIIDCDSGEVVASVGRDGLLSGADILFWLGY